MGLLRLAGSRALASGKLVGIQSIVARAHPFGSRGIFDFVRYRYLSFNRWLLQTLYIPLGPAIPLGLWDRFLDFVCFFGEIF